MSGFEAAEKFAATCAASPLADERRATRLRLGLTPGTIIINTGNQPYFLGGSTGSLSKLIMLRRTKSLVPQVRTVFVVLTREAVCADRDMYRCRLPEGRHSYLGLSRKGLRQHQRLDATQVTSAQLISWRDHFTEAWGPLPVLLSSVFDSAGRQSLATFNTAVLRAVANVLNISPDIWLDVADVEWEVCRLSFWDRLLAAWDTIMGEFNAQVSNEARPFRKDESPVWCYDDGPMRHRVIRYGAQCSCPTTNPPIPAIPIGHLPRFLEARGWRLGFRAVPRLFAYSNVFDGQVTGTGSRYNDVVYRLHCGLPLMPRETATDEFGIELGSTSSASVAGNQRATYVPALALIQVFGLPRLRNVILDLVSHGATDDIAPL